MLTIVGHFQDSPFVAQFHQPTKQIWDIETKGFGIRININGKKTFILKYRIGQERRASNSNILSVDQAIELKDKK